MNPIQWCRKNDIWYLKIDLEIPQECIDEAQAVYDEGFFVDHRYGDGDGWCSAALHSFVHNDEQNTRMGWYHTKNPTGHGLTEESVKWGWTEIADIAPETKRWLEEFPHKKYRRCRFMLLKPQGKIEALCRDVLHFQFHQLRSHPALHQQISLKLVRHTSLYLLVPYKA